MFEVLRGLIEAVAVSTPFWNVLSMFDGSFRYAHILSLAFVCAAQTVRATVEIKCSADTTLHEFFPESNLGAYNQFDSGSTAHALATGPSRTRALIAFDLI